MPSREQAAKVNVRAAIRDAGAEFELKDLARTIDGYSATFQMGMVTHVESGIEDAVVEDEPPTPPLYALIRKIPGIFAGPECPRFDGRTIRSCSIPARAASPLQMLERKGDHRDLAATYGAWPLCVRLAALVEPDWWVHCSRRGGFPFGRYFSSRRDRVGPIIRPSTASKSALGNGLLKTGVPTSRMNGA